MPTPLLFLLHADPTGEVTGVERVDPALPQVSASDLSATRGDGVFESIGVFEGRPQAVEMHLARFARSSAMLDLPAPDLDAWRRLVLGTAAEVADEAHVLLKLIWSRGDEFGDRPTGWLHAFAMPDHTAEHEDGIRVVTLDRGYRSDVAETSPWLLQGAKTLSYAVNKAALREAARRGADDVVFVSTDGVVLEGPNSTVVALVDGVLVSTPPALGVLEGTTQVDLFAWAEAQGRPTALRALGVDELRRASGLWLTSSGRLLAPVVSLDGEDLATDAAFTRAAVEHLRSRTR
ncbi:aminodeoxychorismate lyase [Frigoribacterium salinisoli]